MAVTARWRHEDYHWRGIGTGEKKQCMRVLAIGAARKSEITQEKIPWLRGFRCVGTDR